MFFLDPDTTFLGFKLILKPYQIEEILFQGVNQRCITSSWHEDHRLLKSWAIHFFNSVDLNKWSKVKDARGKIFKGGAQLVAGRAREVEKMIQNPFYGNFEELFKEIQNLDETSDEQVLIFCNKHGLFTPSFPFTGETRSVKGIDYSVEFEEASVEPLNKFQIAIKDFKEVANLYHEYLELSKAKKSSAAEEIYELVIQKLNVQMKKYPVYLHAYRKGRITYPVYYAPSFVSVVWVRMYDWIIETANFKKCTQCGVLFISRRFDHEFCDKNCRDNYNNKLRNARKKKNTREAAFHYGISEKKIKESRRK